MTIQNIIKNCITDVLIKGNGFIYINRGETGLVTSLRWIPANDVSIFYDNIKDVLVYKIPTVSAKVENKNIIHLTKNTNDGYNGRSVLKFAKESISLSQYTEAAAKNFFTSGQSLNGALLPKHPLNPKQMEEIRKHWKQSTDSNTLQIIPYEMEYVSLSSNNSDAQMLETREFNTKEVCRYFGVNPALIQDNTASAYNTLEQINLQFLQYTLMPYIQQIEAEMSRKIFIDEDELYVDMDEERYLLRTDKTSTAQYYGQFIEKGVMSVNEVRKELGMNELQNGGNDHYALYTDTDKSKI